MSSGAYTVWVIQFVSNKVVLPLCSKCLIHCPILLQQWQLKKEKQNVEFLNGSADINTHKTTLISKIYPETCGKNHCATGQEWKHSEKSAEKHISAGK